MFVEEANQTQEMQGAAGNSGSALFFIQLFSIYKNRIVPIDALAQNIGKMPAGT